MGAVTAGPAGLVRCAAGAAAVGIDRSRVAGVERADRLDPRPDAGMPGTLRTRTGEIPVVALAHWFGAEPGPGGQVLVLETAGGRVGLLVDRVSVVGRAGGALLPAPTGIGRAGTWVTGVVVGDDESLVVIDPDQLLADDGPGDDDDAPPARAAAGKSGAVGRWLGIGWACYPGPGDRPVVVAVPVGMVAEVIDAAPPAAVPNAAGHVRGVVGWRGRGLTVLDPLRWVGLDVTTRTDRVLVVRAGGLTLGLAAGDGVKVLDPLAGAIPARRPLAHRADRVSGCFDTSDATVILPDWAALR